MDHVFGYLSGACITISFVPYVVSIFSGHARPERASWFIWAVLGGITFSAQLAKGASHSLWLPGLQTFGDALVFVLSIRYGLGGFARRDRIALAFAGLGLLLWYVTKEPLPALLIAIATDAAGVVLTVMKSGEHPDTEPASTWALTALAGLLATFSVGFSDPALSIYPLYIFLAGTAILLTTGPFRRLFPRKR